MFTKKSFLFLSLITIFVAAFSTSANAKSVYAITDHGLSPYPHSSKISAYDINSSQINWRTTLKLDNSEANYPTGSGAGPVGLAVDPASGCMFVTHESAYGHTCKGIQIIHAETMTDLGWIPAPGAANLAGVVFDNDKQKLYTVDRGTNQLFVYLWNPANRTLILDGGAPKTLASIPGAGGLALDEIDDILYVTVLDEVYDHNPTSNKVYCYSTSNWTLQETIDSPRKAVGVAVYHNGATKYLYTGTYNGADDYLVRTNLNTPHSFTEKNIGASATGIAVDPCTGLVYITDSNSSKNTIKVFNGLNWPSDPCYVVGNDPNINGPAGICVASKPYPVVLAKTDNALAGGVKPGDSFTYTIDYNYPSNDSDWTITLTNVVLTDYLPAEVLHTDVNFSDPNGSYDSNTHTIAWNLGTLSRGASGSVTVAVTVADVTRPTTGYLNNKAKITATQPGENTFIRLTPWYYRVHNDTKNLWYHSIQSAITDNNTTNNDVLVAYPGIYTENIYFDNSKLLTIQSTNPEDPFIVSQTVISGGGSDTVTFTDNNSVINGFSLTNGYNGVYCTGSGPTISNCVIRNNANNGVYSSSSAPTIANCIIKNNSAAGIRCGGTGQVKIRDNLIVNNGVYGVFIFSTTVDVIIRNNTISNNASVGISRGGGNKNPNIVNSIIWNNGTPPNYNNLSGGTFDVTYSCINGGYGDPNAHNIGADPCFVAGDYHLKAASLCRNAGDPNTTLISGETDIDNEPRRNGIGRVDIGGDEFYTTTDLNADGQVNFLDYAVFANAWQTQPGSAKWNPLCDFWDTNTIDISDLAWFAQDWYFPPSTEPPAPAPAPSPPPPPPPPIYLAYDGSMTPDPNTEVTVYVYSDIPLFSMDMVVTVTGDATITSAMGSYDCADYGWDSEWGWDPYIDPNGWVEFGGVSWEGAATGTVGYFKFIYNSGQVTVSITADTYVYDANSEPAAFSTDPLIFGGENIMQSSPQQSMMQSNSEEIAAMDFTEVVDVNELADWLEQLWLEDAEIRTASTPQEWQQFIDALRSSQ